MRYTTPLRYPGGKSKLANFIKLAFEANDLLGGHYAEPYAGGASVAFSLLFYGYASHIHINDLSKSVYAFWHSVLIDADELCRLIFDTPVTMNYWRQQKLVQENPNEHSSLELGFSTFFLNRTNRSGIITGGVIGGKDQDGDWSLDARYNKPALISRIEKISRYKDQISLYNQDATQFIARVVPKLSKKSLIYLDPPYYSKGRRLYENHYQHDDHVVIAGRVAQIKQNWIVSYDDTPEIRKLYRGYRKLPYQLSYSANDRYKGAEILFFGDDLAVPKVENPAKVKLSHR